MKIAMITDQHFGVRNGSKYFLDNYEKFYNEIFFPTIDELGITHVWMLGDFWEYRTRIDVVTLWRAQSMYLDKLEERGIQVTIIYGNHDVAYKNRNDINSIDFLAKMYKNIRVVKTHETIEFDGTPVNFLSWVNNANLAESLEFIKNCPPTILCGHFEIKSFEMIKGHVCEHGFDKSLFDRFDQVYSGHFHTVSTDGRIFYISNPSQTNWSDYGLDKGFRIFDTTTRELEFVPNPFDVYSKIVYNDDIDIVEFDYDGYTDKIVRVYVQSYSSTNQHKLSLFMEKLNKVVYSADLIEIDETQFNSETGDLQFVDNHELIEKYIEEVVQSPTIDKNVLKDMFKEMYREALDMAETE